MEEKEKILNTTNDYTLSNPMFSDIISYSYNNNNITYDIQISFKNQKWQIKRTYIEVQKYMESLHNLKYLFLPKLLPISESGIKETNKSVLQFLRYLNYRFDILSNSITSVFFDYSKLTTLITDISNENLNQIYNFQLGDLNGMTLSDCIYDFDSGLLIIGLENVSFLASIGRFWSLIEYDVLGSLFIYQRLYDKEKRPYFRKLINKNFDARISKLDMCKDKNKFFVALDNGSIMIFNINKIDKTKYSGDEDDFKLIVISDGHIFRYLSDRITGIANNSEILFAIGKENKLIVVNYLQNCELLFSGTIKKRIEGKGYPDNILYEPNSKRIIINTITNIILVYTFSSSTKFTENTARNEFKIDFLLEINCESNIKNIFVSNAVLVIGLETKVQFINFNSKNNDFESNIIPFDGSFGNEISNSSKFLILKYYSNSITTVCYINHLKLLFLGLSDGGLVAFSSKSFEVIFAKKISNSSITKLILLEENEVLLAGDENGNVNFYKLGN